MKILLCSHEMSYTGAPRSLKLMAGVLKEIGHDISVWTLKEGSFKKEFEKEGMMVRTIFFPEMVSEELVEDLRQFSVVIANTIFCAEFAEYAQRYVRTVLYIREAQNLPQLIADCGLDVLHLISAKHLVCVSEYAKLFLQEKYCLHDVTVIPNFVEDVYCKRSNRYKEKAIVDFLVAGTIEPRKGQKIAAEAFKCLPKQEKEYGRLHFVGSMPEWASGYQDELCWDFDDKMIIYHGEIRNRKRLLKLYKHMDVILVPSLDESCSLVALEAAMLGKAILLTENVGAKYLVDRRCIVKTNDSVSLSRKMMECIENPNLLRELGDRNRSRYLEWGTREKYRLNIENYLSIIMR